LIVGFGVLVGAGVSVGVIVGVSVSVGGGTGVSVRGMNGVLVEVGTIVYVDVKVAVGVIVGSGNIVVMGSTNPAMMVAPRAVIATTFNTPERLILPSNQFLKLMLANTLQTIDNNTNPIIMITGPKAPHKVSNGPGT
jgi:hypothetical protein